MGAPIKCMGYFMKSMRTLAVSLLRVKHSEANKYIHEGYRYTN